MAFRSQVKIMAIVYEENLKSDENKSDFVVEDLYPCIQHHVNTEGLCVVGHEDEIVHLERNEFTEMNPFERMFHRPSYISVLENQDIKCTSNLYVPSADYIQKKDHSFFSTLPSSQMMIDRIALQGVKSNTDLSKIVFNKYSYDLFDYPPVRLPKVMNKLKKSFLYHPKVDEYVHLPVRMRNPGSWNNLISVFRMIFAMTRVCDIVCKGIEMSLKNGALTGTRSDTSSYPLIYAFILTASNMDIVAKSQCKSFDDRMIEIQVLHDALQSKVKKPIETMNIPTIIHLVIKSLSDELDLILPAISEEFKDLFRYEQIDGMHCKTCFATQRNTRSQHETPMFLYIKLNYEIDFEANVFHDLSIKPQTIGNDCEKHMFHLEDIITLHNRNWGYVSSNKKCQHAIQLRSSRKSCVVCQGNDQIFSSTYLVIDIDRSDEKNSMQHQNPYGVMIPHVFKMHEGTENEVEYRQVAAIIEDYTDDKVVGATSSLLQIHGGHFYQVTDNGTNFLKETRYFELLSMKSTIVLYVEVKEYTNTLALSSENGVFSYPHFEVKEEIVNAVQNFALVPNSQSVHNLPSKNADSFSGTKRKRSNTTMRIMNAKKTISEKDVSKNALTTLSGKLGVSIVGDNWKNMSDDKSIPKKRRHSSISKEVHEMIEILDSEVEDSDSFGTKESSSKKSLVKTYHSVKGDAIYLVKEKGDKSQFPCLLCSTKTHHRIGQFTYVCGTCTEDKKPSSWKNSSIKGNYALMKKENKNTSHHCISCLERVDDDFHSLGQLKFCKHCITKSRCMCVICTCTNEFSHGHFLAKLKLFAQNNHVKQLQQNTAEHNFINKFFVRIDNSLELFESTALQIASSKSNVQSVQDGIVESNALHTASKNKNVKLVQHGNVFLNTKDFIKVVLPQTIHKQTQNIYMSTDFMKYWIHLVKSNLMKKKDNFKTDICFVENDQQSTVELVMNFITVNKNNRLIVVQQQNTNLFKAFEVDKRTPWLVKVNFFDPHGSEKKEFESILKAWFDNYRPANINIDHRSECSIEIVTNRDLLMNSPRGIKSYDSGYCGIYICYFILSLLTEGKEPINDEVIWKCRIHLGLMCLSGEIIYA